MKQGEKYGFTLATFNLLTCFGHVETEDIGEAKSSAGWSIWREDDPVHLTAAAYVDIAAILSTQAETTSKQPQTGQARQRLVSVVPAPPVATVAVREPAWISGQPRAARGAPRGGKRGGYRGGFQGGRGSGPWRGNRSYPY